MWFLVKEFCVVIQGELNMSTSNKELKLIGYEQAHVFGLFVKKVCIDFSKEAKYIFKGAEATAPVTAAAAAGEGVNESSATIAKANAEAREENSARRESPAAS
jgi:hypothetical protein